MYYCGICYFGMYMIVVCVLCVYDLCNCGMYVYIVYVCVYGMCSITCVVYVHGVGCVCVCVWIWCIYVTHTFCHVMFYPILPDYVESTSLPLWFGAWPWFCYRTWCNTSLSALRSFYRPAWLSMTKIWIYKTQMGARRKSWKAWVKMDNSHGFQLAKVTRSPGLFTLPNRPAWTFLWSVQSGFC